MNHYEVLGVAPTASQEELRRAYLRLARRHHPDRLAAKESLTTDSDARAASERRMRDVNEAWRVLSDPAGRASYDAGLTWSGPGGLTVGTDGGGPVINRPSRRFVPVDDGPHDDADETSWRDRPDEFDPRTALGRVLAVAPPAFVAAGLGFAVLGLVLGARPLAAVALTCLLLGGLLFVAAPVVALARSAAADPDGRRRPPPGRSDGR